MKNKVFAVALSVALSFALWIYVITVVSPGWEDSYRDVPVALQSEALLTERGLMITAISNETVNLRLAGNRSDLTKLNKSNIRVLADVSKIYEPGVHNITYSVYYPGNIPAGAVGVQSKTPDTIRVTVEPRVTKEVPVSVRYSGAVPNGYLCDKENISLDTTVLLISGPESVMNQTTKAIIDLDLSNRTETVMQSVTYTLCDDTDTAVDSRLITKNTEQIQLTLRIARLKELPLSISVVYGGGVTQQNVNITVEPKSILVSGSDNLLKDLTKLDLGTLDMALIENSQSIESAIVLPAGVTNESGVEKATVTVEIQGVKTKKLLVQKFRADNVPEGMKAEWSSRGITVMLRGPEAELNQITGEHLTVVLDFSKANLGAETVNAAIEIAPQFVGVGTVGTYSVTATLKTE